MLVKLTDAPDELIDSLRKLTGQSTASKAVMTAIEDYSGTIAENNRLRLQIYKLKEKLLQSNQVIEGARSAAKVLLDHSSQPSLDL